MKTLSERIENISENIAKLEAIQPMVTEYYAKISTLPDAMVISLGLPCEAYAAREAISIQSKITRKLENLTKRKALLLARRDIQAAQKRLEKGEATAEDLTLLNTTLKEYLLSTEEAI